MGDDPYGVLVDEFRRGRSAGKRVGLACNPAKSRSAPADPQDRPAMPAGTGVRGVNAARVAFVLGRGADGLPDGFLAWVNLPAGATTPTVS